MVKVIDVYFTKPEFSESDSPEAPTFILEDGRKMIPTWSGVKRFAGWMDEKSLKNTE